MSRDYGHVVPTGVMENVADKQRLFEQRSDMVNIVEPEDECHKSCYRKCNRCVAL